MVQKGKSQRNGRNTEKERGTCPPLRGNRMTNVRNAQRKEIKLKGKISNREHMNRGNMNKNYVIEPY